MADIIAHPGRRPDFPTTRRPTTVVAAGIGHGLRLSAVRRAGAGARLCAGCEADVTRSCLSRARVVRAARSACASRPAVRGLPGRPPAYLRAIVAFDYEPPGVALIGQLKTRLRLSLALVLRACWGGRRPGGALPADAVLAAVPASRASLRRRGMNPAMEIARSLARRWICPAAARCCVCAKRHGRRGWAGASAAALAGVFRGQGVRGRHVAWWTT